MCIGGSEGAGKSILCSAIVDHLLADRNQSDVIAYCFFEGLGRGDLAKHILEVILRQMQENDTLPDFLLYSLLPEIESRDSSLSQEAFQSFLRKLLESIRSQTRFVLVLDGVDKDEWIKHVVLDEVTRTNNSRHRSDFIRCIFSGQETCHYNTHKSCSRTISLDNELGVQRDVLHFAESRLADVYPTVATTKSCLASLAKGLCQRGRGLFLWVAFVVENLLFIHSIAEVEKEVQFLPPTIDGLYQRALQNTPPQEIAFLQRAFAWLIAVRRPLEPPELVEALAIEPDSHTSPDIRPLASRVWMCCPLIIVTRESTVRFRHQSVRRYLLSANETDVWATSIVKAHTILAQTCFMLLTPEGTSRSQEVGCASSINNYASTNWPFHYGMVESHNKSIVTALHHSLTVKLHHDCEEFSLPESVRLHQIATTILRIAASYGFAALTRVSLEMGVNQNRSCDSCETPLALAAAGGHSEVVALLIQRGALMGSDNPSRGGTALYLAAAYGYQECVRMLLENGAEADSDAGYPGTTLLHAAAFSGNLESIKRIMSYCPDLNAMITTSGETPLHLAASRGHVKTVKWLVEGLGASDEETQLYSSIVQQRYYQAWTEDLLTRPARTPRRWPGGRESQNTARESMSELQSLCGRYADINMCTREGRTALHLAASNGHVTTVRYLLEMGANANIADNKQCTALRLAVENGHFNAAKLLLTAGADLNFNQLGATLKNTIKNGHDTVANLLAWHFFSAEIMGKPCQRPLLALATKSEQNTVRDAIRKMYPRGHSMSRKARIRGLSQDCKV